MTRLSEVDDSELARLAVLGREPAFQELLIRYEQPIFSLIYRMVRHRELAEDLAQETFVRAFNAIAETAHRSPGRSALVGLCSTLLLMPIFLLGFLGLLISIIGIPLAIAWLPLFWLLVSIAFITGFISIARNAGEWVADSGFRWTDRIQKSNAIHTVFVGLFVLLSGFLIADVISILPFSGFLTGVLILIGCVVTVAASQIGFGAVLLTRAGRRRESWYTQNDTGVADQEADSPREVNTDEDG